MVPFKGSAHGRRSASRAFVAVLAVGAIVLAACSSDDESSDASTAGTEAASSSAPADSGVPGGSDTALVVARGMDVNSLDPSLSYCDTCQIFTTAIYDQYSSSFSSPTASTLAAVLLLLCALLLVGELRLRGLRRYARLGSGAARTVARRPLGRAGAPVLVVASAVVVLALGVPVGSIVRWLVMGTGAAFPVQGLLTSAGTSLALGAAAAVVTTVLALPVAVLAVRHVGRLSSTVERTTYCANALPGIVVALALVTVSLRVVEPLYQTTVLLLAAYAVLYLPRAVVTLRAALEQAPEVLDEVAQSLGASRWSTLRRVTLPLIARGSRAGAALVFLGVVTELTATLLLAPLGTSTLATEFWAQSSQLIYGAAAPYAALMILLSAPATFLLTRDARQAELL